MAPYRKDVRSEAYKAMRRKIRKRRFLRNRLWKRDYMLSHPCVDCGEADLRCLDFDHVTGEKKFSFARVLDTAISTLEREAAKCEIRCANCHRKRHRKEVQFRCEKR